MPAGSTRKLRTLIYPGVTLVAAIVCLIACRVRNDGVPAPPPALDSQVDPAIDAGKPSGASDSVSAKARSDAMMLKPVGEEAQPADPLTTSPVDVFLQGDGINYDIQSPARPFGLDVVDRVHMAGSDEASADFMTNTLPDILDYLQSNAVNRTSLDLVSTEASPDNLMLDNPSSVRVYFVGDAAGYHNSIGINYADGAELVFPNASSAYSADRNGNVRQEYTSADNPLLPGDFVDLGSAEAGSVLDLFIISNGANLGTDAYGIDKTLNADQLAHAKILGVVGDSVVVLGFEDLPNGGDHDYNDVIIAVDVGQENLSAISATLGL